MTAPESMVALEPCPFPELRHWYFQKLDPSQRRGFLALFGVPTHIEMTVGLEHQVLEAAWNTRTRITGGDELVERLTRIAALALHPEPDFSVAFDDIAREAGEALNSLTANKDGLVEALRQAALDLHEAAGRFDCVGKLNPKACSELTRGAARRADAALAAHRGGK